MKFLAFSQATAGVQVLSITKYGGRMEVQARQDTVQAAGQRGFFETVRREMRLRNYSLKTIKAYLSCLRSFVRHFRPRHPRELTSDDIKNYLIRLLVEEKHAAGTVNQVFNALRFLYEDLYKMPFVIGGLPRPQKEKKLPDVLSEIEVKKLFSAVENFKHRTMLMLAYASGLRVGEVVQLRVEDIDGARGMIHIRSAKGKKDRYTILPESLRTQLLTYWKTYKLTKEGWLFPGQDPGYHLSARSIQAVFGRAVRAAGIMKPVSMHTLRHLAREIPTQQENPWLTSMCMCFNPRGINSSTLDSLPISNNV